LLPHGTNCLTVWLRPKQPEFGAMTG